jgi:RNA polymerase sigma-70 factor (ECF subfamily)
LDTHVQTRSGIIAWVGSNIIPFEGELRAWLRRMRISEDEIEDVVQDAYLSITKLSSVAHINSGKNYFFQTAKMVLFQRLRRDRIVPIDRLVEIEALRVADVAPDPEVRTSARMELERVRRLIAALPDRCREIFELRRIEGVPQREIAARLGLPEHTVEQQATRGLKLILKAIAMEDAACEARSLRPKEMPSDARRG